MAVAAAHSASDIKGKCQFVQALVYLPAPPVLDFCLARQHMLYNLGMMVCKADPHCAVLWLATVMGLVLLLSIAIRDH